MSDTGLLEEQQQYLSGFVAGSGLVRSVALSVLPSAPAGAVGPDALQREAQDRFVAAGKTLVAEEQAKRKKHGLDVWDEVVAHARDARYPKGTDVFLFKFQGLFYVAPAQDSFMCRLRFPGGLISAEQLRGVGTLAEQYGGGYADVTTRANLQIRQIKAADTVDLLMGLSELGIINRGAGADNIRNITASPTAGIDPHELIDTRPLARRMHHHILNHRELYGLPRKFNIAFDSGGRISALEDTNDIGFVAVRLKSEPAGKVYFRLLLGGITGHLDFARDTGVLLEPDECVEVADAIVRVFIQHGDRTDRKKARLKYLLDAWGFEKFMQEVETHLKRGLRRLPADECRSNAGTVDRWAHVGVHPQKQAGMSYVGVVLPVGRMTAEQAKGLADLAEVYGNGELRLTVWQNLLIPHISDKQLDDVKRRLEALELGYSAQSIHAGVVACTGNAGCKYAAANTKAHGMLLANTLDEGLPLDVPVNIHLTGCHHSCAQHFIGDIGLIATKVPEGDDLREGYHLFVGGGYGARQQIARELFRNVTIDRLCDLVERMLRAFLEHRNENDSSFQQFVVRHSVDVLKSLFDPENAYATQELS